MFIVNKISENGFSFLELKNTRGAAKAIISLNEGARLQKLSFKRISVIDDELSLPYKETFASSILFPFANRIKNGLYSFEGEKHQFICNENEKENALHGLVYNKKFELIERELSKNSCSVTLLYQEKEKSKGFPFFYNIYVKYTLKENKITVSVKVKNTDNNSFPFTLGWHPYFNSNDLHNSNLKFQSIKKIKFDDNLITSNVVDYSEKTPFQINDKQLDDCYVLKDNLIEFTTPDYTIKIGSDTKENYLQLYTPANQNKIAIEPMTGVSDSFNNKLGLQILEPNKAYNLKWNITFSKTNMGSNE